MEKTKGISFKVVLAIIIAVIVILAIIFVVSKNKSNETNDRLEKMAKEEEIIQNIRNAFDAGREEFVSVWANQEHKDSIDQLLYMARGLDLIYPLKDSGTKDKDGNPVLVVDTTHRIFERMVPRYSEETKATLSKLIMAKAKKPTTPTAPSGQGEDGGMEK